MLIPTINSADSPNSLGTAVNPNASWFFTAGHTGTLEGSDAASADLYAHSVAAFEELQDTLNQQGLTFADVFSVRAMVFSNADGSYSYDGFDRAYGEYFSSPQNPNKPALTTFTVGEGFRSYGLKLEIEVMAAFPDISGPFNHYDVNSQNKMIRTSGPEELTYRKGVAVARHANYTWFSAVTSDGNGTLEQQSRQVFTHLDGQLKRLGLGWDSVVAIRSYFNTDLSVEEMFKAHRPVRQMYMNNEENPHKPAGTSLKVAGLPNNAALAIELVVIKNQ
jgi:enamine deaminase RidA (YjgF/YER057c/UK114 family)